jgi:hypothetical protein
MDDPEERPTFMHGGGGPTLPWSVTHGRQQRRNRRFTVVQLAIVATWGLALVLTLVTDWGYSTWLPFTMTGTVITVTIVGCAWAIRGGKK